MIKLKYNKKAYLHVIQRAIGYHALVKPMAVTIPREIVPATLKRNIVTGGGRDLMASKPFGHTVPMTNNKHARNMELSELLGETRLLLKISYML